MSYATRSIQKDNSTYPTRSITLILSDKQCSSLIHHLTLNNDRILSPMSSYGLIFENETRHNQFKTNEINIKFQFIIVTRIQERKVNTLVSEVQGLPGTRYNDKPDGK